MLNKKVLVAAIVGGLFAAGNAAAVDFTAGNAAAVAATAGKYAKEIKIDTANGTTFAASTGNSIIWNLGQNLSPGEVKYVRVEATSSNLEFGSFNPTTAPSVISGAGVTTGSVNGVGTNVITFSITADAGNAVGDVTNDVKITLPAAFDLYAQEGSDIKISLYDTASQSQQGGTAGLNVFGSYSGAYFTFANSLRWVGTAGGATADVGETPSYTKFLASAVTANLNTGFGIDVINGGTLLADGTPTSVATLLAPTSSVNIYGDFSFIRSSNGASAYDTTAAGRVTAFGATAAAAGNSLTADSAKFVLNGAYTGNVALGPKLATANFNPVIAASNYTARLNAVALQPNTYSVPVLADVKVGEIDRNGTTLQAPLAQTPGGWGSRLVLTNTGSVPRTYTISIMTEEGVTATPHTVTGTIPANGTKVIDDLTTVFTTNGAPRGTLNVDVAGPSNQIQGLYQLVNLTSGSATNHVLVRPNTN